MERIHLLWLCKEMYLVARYGLNIFLENKKWCETFKFVYEYFLIQLFGSCEMRFWTGLYHNGYISYTLKTFDRL